MHSRLIQMEERTLEADARSKRAAAELATSRAKLDDERAKLDALTDANARLRGVVRSEADWERKGVRPALKTVVLGVVSKKVRLC